MQLGLELTSAEPLPDAHVSAAGNIMHGRAHARIVHEEGAPAGISPLAAATTRAATMVPRLLSDLHAPSLQDKSAIL